MKLEVQLKTVFTLFVAVYLSVALLLKRKALSRMTRDAMISLVRAGMPGARYFVNAPFPDEALAKMNATNLLETKPQKGKPSTELYAEAPCGSKLGRGVRRRAPSLETGARAHGGFGHRERHPGVAPPPQPRREQPRVYVWIPVCGEQRLHGGRPESTQELVVERMAKLLWNMTQLVESPAEVRGAACAEGTVANFAVNKLHVQTFAGYDRWASETRNLVTSLPRGLK